MGSYTDLMNVRAWSLVLAAGIGLLATRGAAADRVLLVDGSELEGEVRDLGAGRWAIDGRYGSVVVEDREVAQILREPVSWKVYEQRKANLAEGDAPGRYGLAIYCREHRLEAEYRVLLQEVIRLDPDHEGARRDLGFRFVDGKWMTQEEEYQARGLVLWKERWVTPEERALLDAADESLRLEREMRRKLAELVLQTGDADPVLREEARRKLDALQPAVKVEALISGLYEKDSAIRLYCVEAVGGIPGNPITRALTNRFLQDRQPEVAQAAFAALAERKDPLVRGPLREALRAGTRRVRLRAQYGLGEFGTEEDAWELIRALDQALHMTGTGGVWVEEGSPGRGLGTGAAREGPDIIRVSTGDADSLENDPVLIQAERRVILDALKKLTGYSFGMNVGLWRTWWDLRAERIAKEKALEEEKLRKEEERRAMEEAARRRTEEAIRKEAERGGGSVTDDGG